MLPVLVATLSLSCAGVGGPDFGRGAVGGVAPWEIPPGWLGTQHLFRLSYEGPGASAGLKVALRLQSPRAFEVRVFDRLGRAVWAASSEDGRTLLVDHESERFCRLEGPVTWAGLEDLGPLSPESLPALLLGRVPARPTAGNETSETGAFRFRDTAGATWRGRVDEGGVSSWALYEAGEPRWWWMRTEGGGGILSQRRVGRQVRWEPVAREPLESLGGLSPPATYRERCDELARPNP